MTEGIVVGKVDAFDAARGLGSVVDNRGRVMAFHCTAIADGSRHVEVGTVVAYRAVPGHLGRLEATDLVDIGPVDIGPVDIGS